MDQTQGLKTVAEILRRAGIPFMITGAHASSAYGELRSTRDIDVVIDPTYGAMSDLLESFTGDDFYFDRETAFEALRSSTMFNVIRVAEADKIDFMMLKDTPFHIIAFSRRRELDIGGVMIPFPSPEDMILQKILWARDLGGSVKQDRDVRQMLRRQSGKLDGPYLERWAKDLGVAGELERLRQEAASPERE